MEGWFITGEGVLPPRSPSLGQNGQETANTSSPDPLAMDATEHPTEVRGSLDHPHCSTTTSSWSVSALLAAAPAQKTLDTPGILCQERKDSWQ